MILKGKVKSGMNDLSQRMEQLESYYTKKTGMKLFPGSLNIELEEEFIIDTNNAIRLEKEEYGGTVSVSILPCSIFNRTAFIIRTDKNNEGMGHHPRNIIEVATDIKLRDAFNLVDGDTVEVEVMRYIHSGKLGDIWKHLPLCDILLTEQPKRYLETNSARAKYNIFENASLSYGIYGFYKNCSNSTVRSSKYFDILTEIGLIEKNIYYGSPALAMETLKNTSSYYFCDLEKSSLENIEKFADENNINEVKVVCEDSIKHYLNNDLELGMNDLTLIDPFNPFDLNSDGESFFTIIEKYCSATKILLWYGYDSSNERNEIHNKLNQIAKANKVKMFLYDIYLSDIDEHQRELNPSVPGCGLCAINLSEVSISILGKYLKAVGEYYESQDFEDQVISLSTMYKEL